MKKRASIFVLSIALIMICLTMLYGCNSKLDAKNNYIAFQESEYTVYFNEYKSIDLFCSNDEINPTYTFTSSDTSIATVNDSGANLQVFGKKVGTTTITAEYNDMFATVTINVIAITPNYLGAYNMISQTIMDKGTYSNSSYSYYFERSGEYLYYASYFPSGNKIIFAVFYSDKSSNNNDMLGFTMPMSVDRPTNYYSELIFVYGGFYSVEASFSYYPINGSMYLSTCSPSQYKNSMKQLAETQIINLKYSISNFTTDEFGWDLFDIL